jgi:hypothetical protein
VDSLGKSGENSLKINDFNEDLKYANDKTDSYLIDSFYFSKFPELKNIEFVKDKETQLKGIDKILTFENGKQITIDEKKRRADYGDILLEIWKHRELKKLGWLLTCQCDYISYIIMPTTKIYLLPSLLLKCAWESNKEVWKRRYNMKYSLNMGYTTQNIAIPVNILLEAIKNEISNVFV